MLMKVFMLFTGSGPLVILTSHTSVEDETLLEKLTARDIGKFFSFEISCVLSNAA